jgi:hypothetical protein
MRAGGFERLTGALHMATVRVEQAGAALQDAFAVLGNAAGAAMGAVPSAGAPAGAPGPIRRSLMTRRPRRGLDLTDT